MQKTLAALIFGLALTACGSPEPEVVSSEGEVPTTESAAAAESALPETAVRHAVIFKYREGTTPAQIAEVTDGFRALMTSVPGIIAFEQGENNSPEGKNMGFTHAFLLTFQDAAARDAYLPHPQHMEYVAKLDSLAVVEEAFVFDYDAQP